MDYESRNPQNQSQQNRIEIETQLIVSFRNLATQIVAETAYEWSDLYEMLEDLENDHDWGEEE